MRADEVGKLGVIRGVSLEFQSLRLGIDTTSDNKHVDLRPCQHRGPNYY